MGGARSRSAAAAAAALALLGGGATLALGESGADAGAAAEPRAQVLTSSQRNAVRLGYVRVHIRSPAAGRLRVGARARRADGGRTYRITKVRTVRLRRGAKTLRLRLTRAGRSLLGSCRALVIDSRARSRGRRFGAKPLAVRRDPGRCAASGGRYGSPKDISAPPADPKPLGALSTANSDRCDFLDPAVCLYPWPNDHFTTTDGSKDTGRRLNLNLQSMPRNRAQKPIDPTDQNRADGFSPGNMIVTRVPGLDSQQAFENTGAVPIWDPVRSFDPDQPVVVINARTGQRHLIWAEVDSNPADKANRTLIIRPAKNFEEGERYIVALRRLRGANGNLLEPREEFRAYRDGITTQNAAIEARRAHYDGMFQTLGTAGIAREDLYLAWDFTAASRRSLSVRMLSIRDDAFGQAPLPAGLPPNIAGGLGDSNLADLRIPAQGSPPPVMVPNLLKVTDFTLEQDSRIARKVEGKVYVPCYLFPTCDPGSRFQLGQNGLPQRNLLPHQAAFTCHIPRVALGAGAGNARISLYGHGLLGSRGEIGQGQLKDFGQEKNVVFCSVDWIGMACADVEIPDPDDPTGFMEGILADIADGRPPNVPNCDLPNVLTILQDLSQFPTLADRVQQGMLNFLYVGRLMAHPQGLGALPAFKVNGQTILDTTHPDGRTHLNYDGNSQGGIIGGALAAVAVDHERAVLGVPGMNYSTLLRRSVDFDAYAEGNFEGVETELGMYDNYPTEIDRPLMLSLIQLLWDRAEANGYAQHMTDDPYPNTPAHDVLLHVGFGDHQVADVSAEVEARTIGARLHRPGLDADRPRYLGRSAPEKELSWYGLPAIQYPYDGSGLVFWDIGPLRPGGCEAPGPPDCAGTPPPPPGNVPPRTGVDPHEFPRRSAAARTQKSAFFDGSLIDVCAGGPCYAGTWTGSP